MWQTVWRKRRIIDSFYQRLSPQKLRSHSDMPTMSLQIFQFSKFASTCIFATFKFFQSYAEIYMVSIFLRNLCQIVSGKANIFLPLSLNPRLGFLLGLVPMIELLFVPSLFHCFLDFYKCNFAITFLLFKKFPDNKYDQKDFWDLFIQWQRLKFVPKDSGVP